MFDALAAYNFWNGEHIETGFVREAYLERLSSYLGNKLVKIVLGQRRTGKSYVLRMVMRHLIEKQHVPPRNIFYVFSVLPQCRKSGRLPAFGRAA